MSNLKREIAIAMILVLLVGVLSSCSSKEEKGQETRTITDVTGDKVEIPQKVTKVVNLVPFGCQIMIGLGLGDYLVGINEETIETEWIVEMYPRIEDITAYSYEVDAEALLAVNPDIVLCEDQDTARELREKGINAITIMYYSIDDFKYDINLIGEILGGDAKKKCDLYLEYFDNNVKDVEEKLQNVIEDKETMYYINGNADRGFYKTCGAGSTNEACAKLSFVDLVTSSLISSPETKVDAEALLATNPENIIIGGRYQHVLYDEIFEAEEWKEISAIKESNVFKVPMGMAAWNRYSIEIALMIPWTASVIYPEDYEFDAVKETIEFYKTFSGYELTEEQANYIIEGLTPDGDKEIASR